MLKNTTMNTFNKIKLAVAGVATTLGTLILTGVAHAQAAWSTTTLGTAIDTVSGTSYDYFTVLISKFWPFLLAALVVGGVVGFAIAFITRLFRK